jgi:glutathione S-transferase
MALEHHQGRVEYEWVEALGWYQQEDKDNVTGNNKHEWYYHWKADELKRVNPSALVPTLMPILIDDGKADESKPVYESLVTIDYIDAVSKAQGTDRLVSEDPYQAARQRIWTDKVNRECCSPY